MTTSISKDDNDARTKLTFGQIRSILRDKKVKELHYNKDDDTYILEIEINSTGNNTKQIHLDLECIECIFKGYSHCNQNLDDKFFSLWLDAISLKNK
jgi:hypothetical protein